MPEGLMTNAGISGGVHDDPDSPPPPTADAPRGWTWNRKDRSWAPRQRGPVLWPAEGQQQDLQDTGVPAGSTARDPDPAWRSRTDSSIDAGGGGGSWDPRLVDDETRGEIQGMLALFYSIPADFLITVDPYCFGALNENLDATIAATVPIICRSKLAVEYITSASGLILWVKLLATLKPFWVAVWQHHVTRQVELVEEEDEAGEKTGQIVVLKQDFSAYPAA